MLPGPNQILKTPRTGTIVKIATILSGNTLFARYWTDGKRDMPMLPDSPWLRRAPDSDELFWTNECERLGEVWSADNSGSRYADVRFAETPAMEDYLRALSSGLGSSLPKERYIRLRMWWVANDPVRFGEIPSPIWSGHRDNLTHLLTLLDESDPEQRVLAAEAHRELGDFVRAMELLSFAFTERHQRAADCIKTLSEQGNSTVGELPQVSSRVPKAAGK